MTVDLIEAAVEWAEIGVPVFPVASDKRPITPNGHLDASTDPDVVRLMFARHGAWGIGAAMGAASGLFAIDADTYKPGEAGQAAVAYIASLRDRGLLPATRTHMTQSGGAHYLFKSDDGWPNCKPSLGVEVKGEGGYIILPPSPGYTEDATPVAIAPAALIAALGERRGRPSTIDALKASILSGDDFHDSMTQLSAKLAASGLPPEVVQKTLLDTLDASAARSPAHPRHTRWKALAGNRGNELTRIVTSGHDKYSPLRGSEKLREAVAGGASPLFQAALAQIPTAPVEAAQPLTAPIGEDWPFEHEKGYFGSTNLDILTQKFVVHPILSEGEVTLISAAPKAGKTLVAETIAMHIAAGFDIGNMKVYERRPVLYFALESQVAIRKRLVAWKTYHDPDGTILNASNFQLYVSEAPRNLLNDDVRTDLANKIAAADKWYQNNGAAPVGAIVIDTLTKAMPGGDQNSVEDTSKVFEITQEIRSLGVNAPIIFIHHNTKDGAAPRGSSNIQAEPDTLLTLAKNDVTSQLELKILMARSIEDTETFLFDVETVNLGTTSQGFEITAPVLLPDAIHRVDNATIVREKAATAEKFADFHRVLKDMGPGTHSRTQVHNAFKAALGTSSYSKWASMRANSQAVAGFFTHLIPATGLIIENRYSVSVRTDVDKRNDLQLVGITINRLEAVATA